MVKQRNNLFICEACNLKYKEERVAKQCQEFCNKYKSCNIDLIKKAVKTK